MVRQRRIHFCLLHYFDLVSIKYYINFIASCINNCSCFTGSEMIEMLFKATVYFVPLLFQDS